MATPSVLINLSRAHLVDLARLAGGDEVTEDRCDALVDAGLAERHGTATAPARAVATALDSMVRAGHSLAAAHDAGHRQGVVHFFLAEPAVAHVAAGDRIQLALLPSTGVVERLTALVHLSDRPVAKGSAFSCMFGAVRKARTDGPIAFPAEGAAFASALGGFRSSTHVTLTRRDGRPGGRSIAWVDLGAGGLWTATPVDSLVLVPSPDDEVHVAPASRADIVALLGILADSAMGAHVPSQERLPAL